MNLYSKWIIFSASICCLSLQNQVVGAGVPQKEERQCLIPPDAHINSYYLTAGFILEQMRVTGSQFAYSKYGNAVGTTALPATARTLEPSFKLRWGVTAGLGYYFSEEHWTLTSRFDWLRSKGKASYYAGLDSNIIPIHMWRDQFYAPAGADLGVAGVGTSKFTISYYNVNVDLNRAMYIDKYFTLEPHIGLKLALIYDNVTTQFSGNGADTSLAPSTDLSPNLLMRKQKTHFWGLGPSFGINSDWNCFCGLSLFMEGTASILVGNAKATDSVTCSRFAVSQTYSSSPNLPVFSPTIQTLLGLKYETNICNDSQRILAKLGWDSAIYWNQWNHINVVSASTFNSSLDTFQLQEGDTFGLTGLLFNLTWNF